MQFDDDGATPVHVMPNATCGLGELIDAVSGVCQESRERPGAPLILALGASGPSAREWPGATSMTQVSRWEKCVRRLEQLPAVIISLAEQTCGGPALRLLLASDYRVASPEFQLMLPILDGQFWPGMELFHLVAEVGLARARQLVLWGDMLDAQRALDLGLLNEIAPDPYAAGLSAAALLGRFPPRDHAIRRQLLREAASTSYEDALSAHLAACAREQRRFQGEDDDDQVEPIAFDDRRPSAETR